MFLISSIASSHGGVLKEWRLKIAAQTPWRYINTPTSSQSLSHIFIERFYALKHIFESKTERLSTQALVESCSNHETQAEIISDEFFINALIILLLSQYLSPQQNY